MWGTALRVTAVPCRVADVSYRRFLSGVASVVGDEGGSVDSVVAHVRGSLTLTCVAPSSVPPSSVPHVRASLMLTSVADLARLSALA